MYKVRLVSHLIHSHVGDSAHKYANILCIQLIIIISNIFSFDQVLYKNLKIDNLSHSAGIFLKIPNDSAGCVKKLPLQSLIFLLFMKFVLLINSTDCLEKICALSSK